jgi:hypothetical protein
MAHIPSGAVWYVGEIVVEISVEGETSSIMHKNLTLIRADSADEAYQKALRLGHESEITYPNPAGKQVHIEFRGLSDLNVIHGELEDGTELLFEEKVGMSKEEIQKSARSKEQLNVFRPITPTQGPSYSAGEIMREVERILRRPNG